MAVNNGLTEKITMQLAMVVFWAVLGFGAVEVATGKVYPPGEVYLRQETVQVSARPLFPWTFHASPC